MTKISSPATLVSRTTNEASGRRPICASLWKGKACQTDKCDRTHLPLCTNASCHPTRLADCKSWHSKPPKAVALGNADRRKQGPGTSSGSKGSRTNKKKSFVATQLEAAKRLKVKVVALEKEKRRSHHRKQQDQQVQQQVKEELQKLGVTQPSWAQVVASTVPRPPLLTQLSTVPTTATPLDPSASVRGLPPTDVLQIREEMAQMADMLARLTSRLSMF